MHLFPRRLSWLQREIYYSFDIPCHQKNPESHPSLTSSLMKDENSRAWRRRAGLQLDVQRRREKYRRHDICAAFVVLAYYLADAITLRNWSTFHTQKYIPAKYLNMSVPIDRHQYVYPHIMLSVSFPCTPGIFCFSSVAYALPVHQSGRIFWKGSKQRWYVSDSAGNGEEMGDEGWLYVPASLAWMETKM